MAEVNSDPQPRLFLCLDALRGVAAIAVVQFHLARFFGFLVFPHGYLAVDFFFMLSGFVLTFAYQTKLDQGWSTWMFFKTRMVRLYPLYLLGTLAGLGFIFVRDRFGNFQTPIGTTVTLAVFGFLLLPMPPNVLPDSMHVFALNGPAWSLFHEVLANLVHALVLRRRSDRFLAAVMIASAALTVPSILKDKAVDFGAERGDLLGAFGRVLFSYTLGILLFRFWKAGKAAKIRIHPLLLCLLLWAFLAIPTSAHFNLIIDLLLIFAVLPVIVLGGATAVTPPSFARLFHLLGVSSYAVYVIHSPISLYFDVLWRRVLKHPTPVDAPWAGFIYLGLVLVLAVVLDFVYDLPVRAYLGKKFLASVPRRQSVAG